MATAKGFDNSNATVAAVAAPGAGYRIAYKKLKLNVDTADTVIIKSDTTELDRYILAENGGVIEDLGGNEKRWIRCAENKALNLAKTAETGLAYKVEYKLEEV